MQNFRKKPVIIQAMQLLPHTIKDVYEFVHGPAKIQTDYAQEKWEDYEAIVRREGLRLKTMESHNETQVAKMTDWIIRGIQGEFYPCDNEVFLKTYEPA